MIETAFHSDELPVVDRFEWWRDLTARTLTPTVITSEHEDDFRAGLRLLDLGATQASVLSYPSLRSRRTPALVRRSDPELYHLFLTLRGGQTISQGGRDASVGAGDLLLYDSSHPTDAQVFPEDGGAVEGIIVNMSRAAFPLPAAKVDRLLATSLPGGSGMGMLLSQFLIHLAAEAAAMRPQDAVRLGTVVLDLVTAFLAQHLDAADTVPPERRQQALMVAIHSFVERNLGDPELSPASVAAAHHISVRYLYRLYQGQGTTIADGIRRSRLRRIHRDLADPRLDGRSISSIAARWGFPEPTSFSRAFKTLYGITPRDHRDTTRLPGRSPCVECQRPCTACQQPREHVQHDVLGYRPR
ncbi:helix-turn-helix domain-containing protein [Streptomyces sp. NBC_01451]|uniref:AraC-like ligand-binding domain-containing protein n=1 Tax=Streptomyces sp. NBC_01451 TaxID=2903872 RepID=UPI002E372946|nr:helix-turn-helix domain-containing protein [Streptomyces sp. NBC_01451]